MDRIKKSDKPVFEVKDRGYVGRGFWLEDCAESQGDALIEVLKDDMVVRSFVFPAYKIWNIPSHFHDIVDSELQKNTLGYKLAGSDGLGGNVFVG